MKANRKQNMKDRLPKNLINKLNSQRGKVTIQSTPKYASDERSISLFSGKKIVE